MKRETLFLKIVLYLIVIVTALVCLFGLPWVTNGLKEQHSDLSYFVIVIYISVIPFIFALYQSLKILSYIDQNKAFSDLSVTALKNIKNCGVIISVLYALSMPFIYIIGDKEDAPGIILLGLIIVFASVVVSVFAAVLQKLLKNAVELKSENDLTV